MSYVSHDGQIRYFPPDKNIFFFYMSPYKIWVLTWKILQALHFIFRQIYLLSSPYSLARFQLGL